MHHEGEIIENSTTTLLKGKLEKKNQELEQRIIERTQSLESALNAREQFIAIAFHELKTPLTALRLYIDGMLHKQVNDPEKLAHLFRNIQEQSIYLENLINSLLDITTVLKNGNLPSAIQPQKMDLAKLVQDIAERFSQDFHAANCTVTLKIDKPVIGWWDPIRIDQVINNLISNVIKHAPCAPVTISVVEENQLAKLLVHDQGPGILMTDRPNIFNLFFQGSKKSDNKGFGIGLWLIKQFIEMHQGTIDLIDVDTGSCFLVCLPLKAE